MKDPNFNIEKSPAFGPGGERWIYDVVRDGVKGKRTVLATFIDYNKAEASLSALRKNYQHEVTNRSVPSFHYPTAIFGALVATVVFIIVGMI